MYWFIGNKHTPVEFLPVRFSDKNLEREKSEKHEENSVFGATSSLTVPFKSGIKSTADLARMERRIVVLHEDMKIVIETLLQ